MAPATYALGLDSSTQSLTAVLIDIGDRKIVFQKSLSYASDGRLDGFGIDRRSVIIPPREPGEADQPPAMFLASIDAMFSDLKAAGIDLGRIAVVNCSAQQHGHVYCAASARTAIEALASAGDGSSLVERFEGAFSYGTAPIWKTSNTVRQADDLRKGAGGKEGMIRLSGSDSPLRFSGSVIRRVGEQFPECYRNTARIFLLSNFIAALLSANWDAPCDFGNACGTSLMDYDKKDWSPVLLKAVAEGLPEGEAGLRKKLPRLASPTSTAGKIARYFSARYGFSPDCLVGTGSGDNPQSKVVILGDLLSLGTSFVAMVATVPTAREWGGFANAMYDGLGRSFMFGCRTNGALVWDRVRALHGLAREDYGPANAALDATAPGSVLTMWQPDSESFPPSKKFDIVRGQPSSLGGDYAGIVDSSLGLTWLFSRPFARTDAKEPLALTGGPAAQPEILRRAAGIWNRPVVTIGRAGAALGAAVAGAAVLASFRNEEFDAEALSSAALPRGTVVEPRAADVAAYHGKDGYLARLEREFAKVSG
jgi:xylulokinase